MLVNPILLTICNFPQIVTVISLKVPPKVLLPLSVANKVKVPKELVPLNLDKGWLACCIPPKPGLVPQLNAAPLSSKVTLKLIPVGQSRL